jgi:hypothetical protein
MGGQGERVVGPEYKSNKNIKRRPETIGTALDI